MIKGRFVRVLVKTSTNPILITTVDGSRQQAAESARVVEEIMTVVVVSTTAKMHNFSCL